MKNFHCTLLLTLFCASNFAIAADTPTGLEERVQRLEERIDELSKRLPVTEPAIGSSADSREQDQRPARSGGTKSVVGPADRTGPISPARLDFLHGRRAYDLSEFLILWTVMACVACSTFVGVRFVTSLFKIGKFDAVDPDAAAVQERINEVVDFTGDSTEEIERVSKIKLPWDIYLAGSAPRKGRFDAAPEEPAGEKESIRTGEVVISMYSLRLAEADCAMRLWPDGEVVDPWLRLRGKDIEAKEIPTGLLANAQVSLWAYLVRRRSTPTPEELSWLG